MRPYNEYLEAVTAYIRKHGETNETIDRLETMLPPAWFAELVTEATEALNLETLSTSNP